VKDVGAAFPVTLEAEGTFPLGNGSPSSNSPPSGFAAIGAGVASAGTGSAMPDEDNFGTAAAEAERMAEETGAGWMSASSGSLPAAMGCGPGKVAAPVANGADGEIYCTAVVVSTFGI